MPDFNPKEPDYAKMHYMIQTISGNKKQKNEYLGHRLQKLRAKLQLKGKNVDKKLLDKCRRYWSSLVRDADRRQTSEEVKAENQSIFTKGIDLSKENYPIF